MNTERRNTTDLGRGDLSEQQNLTRCVIDDKTALTCETPRSAAAARTGPGVGAPGRVTATPPAAPPTGEIAERAGRRPRPAGSIRPLPAQTADRRLRRPRLAAAAVTGPACGGATSRPGRARRRNTAAGCTPRIATEPARPGILGLTQSDPAAIGRPGWRGRSLERKKFTRPGRVTPAGGAWNPVPGGPAGSETRATRGRERARAWRSVGSCSVDGLSQVRSCSPAPRSVSPPAP